jgi:hypothetical protein
MVYAWCRIVVRVFHQGKSGAMALKLAKLLTCFKVCLVTLLNY